MTKSRRRRPDNDELLARPYPTLIPEGPYLAFCTRQYWDKGSRLYGERIYLYFKIFDGEYNGKEIRMFLRPSKFPTSNLYRAWAIASGYPPRSRNTKLSPRIFPGKLFRVSVVTVKPRHRIVGTDGKTRQGDFLPDFLWYSKIASILSLEVTNSPICEPTSTIFNSDGTNSPTEELNKASQDLSLRGAGLGGGDWGLGIRQQTTF